MISKSSVSWPVPRLGLSGGFEKSVRSIPKMLSRPEFGEKIGINHVTVSRLDAGLKMPFPIASDKFSRLTGVENLLVTVRTVDGIMGFGEAAPFPGISNDDPETLNSDIWMFVRRLQGGALNVFQLEELLKERLVFPSARAAIEMAFFDVLAKRAGVPLYKFLNPSADDEEFITDMTIPLLDSDASVRLAGEFAKQGFSRLKIKVGEEAFSDASNVMAINDAYRQAKGRSTLDLLLDANEGYNFTDVTSLIVALKGADIFPRVIEQPVPRDQVGDLKRVKSKINEYGIWVFADESIYSAQDAQHIEETNAADGINLKLMKHGGIIEALRIAEIAIKSGFKLMVGGMVETRLAMTASLHLAAALGNENVFWVDLDTPLFIKEDPFTGGMIYDGEKVSLPDTPGIGVTPVGFHEML